MTDELPRVIADYRSSAGPRVTQVRGSVLASSLLTLRELGMFPRYLEQLSREYHDAVVYAIASSWVPVEAALEHYRACDALQLDEPALQAVGRHVGERITGTFLATIVRGARTVGAGRPLAVLQNYHRIWERLLLGGVCTVTQTGPKDVKIDSRGVPMFRYRYFRVGYAAMITGAAAMFGRAVYPKILRADEISMVLGVSWV